MRSVLILALVTAAAPAIAGGPPPPGTVPAGKLNVAVNLEIEMAKDRAFKPVTIAPDASYGVTDDLTVGVVHSLFGVTGFRARAGGGLCVTGEDNGCAHLYNNVGAEAWYAVARGPMSATVGGGFHALDLDGGFYNAKLGAKVRYAAGLIGVHAQPSVLVAVSKREDDAGNRVNRDTLWVPVQITYKATPELTAGLGTGIKGPLDAFGDAWEIPLGAMATYAVDPTLTVGGSLVFGKLLGGADDPPDPAPPVKGVNFRGVQLWVGKTL